MHKLPRPDDIISVIGPIIGTIMAFAAIVGALVGAPNGSSQKSGQTHTNPQGVVVDVTSTPQETPELTRTSFTQTTTGSHVPSEKTPETETTATPSEPQSTTPNTMTVERRTAPSMPTPQLQPPFIGEPVTTNTGSHVVNQGDTIYLSDDERRVRGWCTVGYLDAKSHTGLTAAHCLSPLTGTYDPNTEVTAYTPDWEPIGRAFGYGPYFTEGAQARHDTALLRFDDNVVIGNNIYSGDRVLSYPNDREPFDRICMYGGMSKQVRCTERDPIYNDLLFNALISGATHGDSGGVMWAVAPDGTSRGIIGTLVGFAHNDNSEIELSAFRVNTIDPTKYDLR